MNITMDYNSLFINQILEELVRIKKILVKITCKNMKKE
jgi:hypothetical protein